jgi:hypothetical protein
MTGLQLGSKVRIVDFFGLNSRVLSSSDSRVKPRAANPA